MLTYLSRRYGSNALKPMLLLSAFDDQCDPVSRAYYDRKIQPGKRHNPSLVVAAPAPRCAFAMHLGREQIMC